MNTLTELVEIIRDNPRLACAAALGDVLVATTVTLVILALTGNLG